MLQLQVSSATEGTDEHCRIDRSRNPLWVTTHWRLNGAAVPNHVRACLAHWRLNCAGAMCGCHSHLGSRWARVVISCRRGGVRPRACLAAADCEPESYRSISFSVNKGRHSGFTEDLPAVCLQAQYAVIARHLLDFLIAGMYSVQALETSPTPGVYAFRSTGRHKCQNFRGWMSVKACGYVHPT